MATMIKDSVYFQTSPPTALFGGRADHTCSPSPAYGRAAKAFRCCTTAAAQLDQCSAVCLDALCLFQPGLH